MTLHVPERFRRGGFRCDEARSVQSGLELLDWVERSKPLEGATILDFGCGVKIAQALVEKSSPQRLYVGVDVYASMIEHMAQTFRDDRRYRFRKVPFKNAMYNPNGEPMTSRSSLPIERADFDIILMFSVLTHMTPEDAHAALSLLRRYVGDEGMLFCWAFAREDQAEAFVDGLPDRPLARARYRQDAIEGIIRDAGWAIRSAVVRRRQWRIVDYVCTPTGAAGDRASGSPA